MKNIIKYVVAFFVVSALLLVGCAKDDELAGMIGSDAPLQIVFAVGENNFEGMDLDKSVGEEVWGTVRSSHGIDNVIFYSVSDSGDVLFDGVSDFDESQKNEYHFKVIPIYDKNMTGVRVVAEDITGEKTEKLMPLSASGGDGGPVYNKFSEDTLFVNIGLGEAPAIVGEVASHWGLGVVRYFTVNTDGTEEVHGSKEVLDGETSYDVSEIPAYAIGMTGLKIVSTDIRHVESEMIIPFVVLEALPAPVIVFDQENVAADLLSTPQVLPNVTGNIVSEEGLASVRLYISFGANDEFSEEITSFTDNMNYDFDMVPNYKFGMSGVKIVARDVKGQTSETSIAATVNAIDTDLITYSNVVMDGVGDRREDGVVIGFSVSDGSTHALPDIEVDTELQALIDFVTADSGGDDKLDFVAPSDDWMFNSVFKSGPLGDGDPTANEWPVRNETWIRILYAEGSAESDAYFASATSATVREASLGELGDDSKTKNEIVSLGGVAYLETASGAQVLVHWVGHDPNTDGGGKADIFTLDFKVVK